MCESTEEFKQHESGAMDEAVKKSFDRGMKRSRAAAGRILCIAAAVFVSLSPIFSSLHIASCSHEDADHALCCRSEKHDSGGSENFRKLVGDSRPQRGHRHDPSTCPICRTFEQLMQGAQAAVPAQAELTLPERDLVIPCPERNAPGDRFFSIALPRAPPAV